MYKNNRREWSLKHKNAEFSKYRLKTIDSKLPFTDKTFHVVTGLSVIEHGEDIERFIKEVGLILKTKGILFISTNFLCGKIDTSAIYPYGKQFGEMKIFTPDDIKNEVIPTLFSNGMDLLKELTFNCDKRIISW